MGHLRQLIFGLSLSEADFERRRFHCLDLSARQRLEKIGRVFIEGYNAALKDESPQRLGSFLNSIELEFRGFAFEGAAMGLTLMDYLLPWKRNRFGTFLGGAGNAHTYMAHVGAGWALARLRRNPEAFMKGLDSLLRWLVVDGYGFHEGYFHWQRYITGQQSPPEKLSGYARRVFDQGLGRSLWFVAGADVARIAKTISAFPERRQSNLWSGIGLACAYAGGAEPSAIENLKYFAGAYHLQLAQGCAFAAKTRERACNVAQHTEVACRIICGVSADEAASVTDIALRDLAADEERPAYEIWRRRIQSHFALEVTLV
jgi:enediyne biosynthesis protein E3